MVGKYERRKPSPEKVAEGYIRHKGDPMYVQKKFFGDLKGWGVVISCDVPKGAFLLEYRGKHTLHTDMAEKLQDYNQNGLSYVFEYEVNKVKYCIDATTDDGSLGRLVNDSWYFPNAVMKRITIEDEHHLCLFALNNIAAGEEVLYTYGVKDLPWHKEERERKYKGKCNKLVGENGDCSQKTEKLHADIILEPKAKTFHNDENSEAGTTDSPNGNKDISLTEFGDVGGTDFKVHYRGDKKSVEIIDDESIECSKNLSKCPDFGLKEASFDDLLFFADTEPSSGPDSDSDGGGDEVYKAVKFLQNNPLPCDEHSPSLAMDKIVRGNSSGSSEHRFESAGINQQDNVCGKNDGAPVNESESAGNNEQEEQVLKDLCETMRAGNSAKAKELFSNWLTKKEVSSKTLKCPICGQLKTNLKQHVIRVHNMDEINASGLASQTGQLHLERKAIKRKHPRRVCPVSACAKVVTRIHNHLKSTHKITDPAIYRRCLQESEIYVEPNESESETSDSESEESDDDEVECEMVKRIYKKGGSQYLKRTKDLPMDSDSTSDEDWFAAKVEKLKRRKVTKQRCIQKTNKKNVAELLSKDGSEEEFNETNDVEEEHNSEVDFLVPHNDNDTPAREHKENKCENEATVVQNEVIPSGSANDVEENTCDGIEKFIPFVNENEFNDNDGTEDEDRDDEDENIDNAMTPWKESSLFDGFFNWLISADGKCVPSRQAKQHMKQVILILQECSDNTYIMSCLFDRKSIRDKWLVGFDIRRKAGTVKSYIHSLRFFYKFLLSEQQYGKYQDKIPSLVIMCENWISVYRKKAKKNRWKRDMEQFSQLFTGEEVRKLDESELIQYCRKVVKSFKCKELLPSLKQFTNVRDYILMNLCLDNASRTGALANMTLKEFRKANYKNDNDRYVVAVLNHKTLETAGPAVIVFTPQLYKDTLVYVEKIRNKLDGITSIDDDAVFVSWSGKKMSSSMVTAQINSFWGKAVGHSQERPRISATLVRKSAVSKVHENKREMRGNLAHLMCHSKETAKRIYYLQEKSKKAAETSASLHTVFRQDDHVDDRDDDIVDEITKHFGEDIKRKKITIAIVREKIGLSERFRDFSEIALRDKIRHIIKKEEECKEESSSEEESATASNASSIPSWGASRKDRVVFSDTDLKLIRSIFGMMITADKDTRIRTRDFKRLLQENEQANALLKKYGEYTLLSKVRTERKAFLREM